MSFMRVLVPDLDFCKFTCQNLVLYSGSVPLVPRGILELPGGRTVGVIGEIG